MRLRWTWCCAFCGPRDAWLRRKYLQRSKHGGTSLCLAFSLSSSSFASDFSRWACADVGSEAGFSGPCASGRVATRHANRGFSAHDEIIRSRRFGSAKIRAPLKYLQPPDDAHRNPRECRLHHRHLRAHRRAVALAAGARAQYRELAAESVPSLDWINLAGPGLSKYLQPRLCSS